MALNLYYLFYNVFDVSGLQYHFDWRVALFRQGRRDQLKQDLQLHFFPQLDPTAGKEFMGFIVAANPLAQMLFSPLVGWWSNRVQHIHMPLLASVFLFTLASGWYAILDWFPSFHKYWMLLTRFLVGMSSANIAVCRSYLSAATKLDERTQAVSMVSFAQVLGFIVGPGEFFFGLYRVEIFF